MAGTAYLLVPAAGTTNIPRSPRVTTIASRSRGSREGTGCCGNRRGVVGVERLSGGSLQLTQVGSDGGRATITSEIPMFGVDDDGASPRSAVTLAMVSGVSTPFA